MRKRSAAPLRSGVGEGLHLWAAPKHNGSETSRAAAERVDTAAISLRARVHAWLIQRGVAGGTHEEIAAGTGIRLDTVKARVHELGTTGDVRGLDATRPTSTGSPAMVFVSSEWAEMCRRAGVPIAVWPRTRENEWKRRALEAEAEVARLRAERTST